MKIANNLPRFASEETKAPISHSSVSKTYGGGTSLEYGHVKLSDNYTESDGTADSSVGASSKAIADAYNELNSNLTQNSAGQFILPNGLKICWGNVDTINSNGYWRHGEISFPIIYNNVPTVIVTKLLSSNLTSIETQTTTGVSKNMTVTGGKVYIGVSSSSIGNEEITLNWLAIGY